jgi:hypothetical protein
MLKRFFFPGLLILSSAVGTVYLQLQTTKQSQNIATKTQYQQAEKEQKISLDFLKRSPNLGFDNIIADWIYLNFIQYFGDTTARDQTSYELSSQYFEAIVDRDPRFVMAYSLLDPATSLFAGQASRSVEIMDKGLKTLTKNIPDAYLVWTYKGIDELLFLGKGKEAQQSYEKAAEWALYQGDEKSILLGKRFAEMAKFLENNHDSKKAQAGSWLMVLSNAKDKKTVDIALDKIRRLGGKVNIEGNIVNVSFPDQY